MFMARVKGNVVTSHKVEKMKGRLIDGKDVVITSAPGVHLLLLIPSEPVLASWSSSPRDPVPG